MTTYAHTQAAKIQLQAAFKRSAITHRRATSTVAILIVCGVRYSQESFDDGSFPIYSMLKNGRWNYLTAARCYAEMFQI